MISIIVPMYNAEKTIEKCVKSIQASLYTDIEIILVNDGSTDRTLEICQNLQQNDERIIIINKKNSGAGLSRQAGMEKANGEYYAFVDADDWVEKDIYIKMKETLEQSNADVCISGYIKQMESGEFQEVAPQYPKSEYEKEEIKTYLLHNCVWFAKDGYSESPISTVWMCMYKADIIKKYRLNFYSEREYYSEDSIFNLNYLIHCNKVCFMKECPYVFVRSGKSMSCRYDERYYMIDNWYEEIVNLCDESELKYIEGYLNNSYMALAMGAVDNTIKMGGDIKDAYKKLKFMKKIKIRTIADARIKRKVLYFLLKNHKKIYRQIAKNKRVS